MEAARSGAAGVRDLGATGATGTCSGNSSRDLLCLILKQKTGHIADIEKMRRHGQVEELTQMRSFDLLEVSHFHG